MIDPYSLKKAKEDEEETKAPEEAGKEEKDEDAHEIMLDLGDAATQRTEKSTYAGTAQTDSF